ncbi:hypothetical protein CW705_02615 [Candidatus Bathyarchaeota archaeon]|nr:MAG: hypothetical protein CW705_02615 [Candidatus Bathyarchaeota archaeon]
MTSIITHQLRFLYITKIENKTVFPETDLQASFSKCRVVTPASYDRAALPCDLRLSLIDYNGTSFLFRRMLIVWVGFYYEEAFKLGETWVFLC